MVRHAIGLNIGRVLARSFSIFGRNLLPFALLSLVIQSPLIGFALLAPVRTAGQAQLYELVVDLAPSALALVTAGAVAFGVFRQLQGEKAGLGDCLRVGLSRLGRVIGVALAVGLLIGAATGVVVFLSWKVFGLLGLLFIPVMMLTCAYWVAVPCAVVEGTGIGQSMRRSAFLTKDARLPIFGVILVIALISAGAGLLIHVIAPEPEQEAAPKPPGFRSDPDLSDRQNHDRMQAELAAYEDELALARVRTKRPQSVLTMIASAFLNCLSAVAAVVVYHDLRGQKEQVGIEKIVEVFA
jgi:hypothetical protein